MSASELFPHPYMSYLQEIRSEIPEIAKTTPEDLYNKMKLFPELDSSHYEIFDSSVDRYSDIKRVKATSVKLANGSLFNGNFVTLITEQSFISMHAPRTIRDHSPYLKEKTFWEVFKEKHVKGIVNLTHITDRLSTLRYTGLDSDPYLLKDEGTKSIYQDKFSKMGEVFENSFHSSEHEFCHIVSVDAWANLPTTPVTPECLSEESLSYSDNSQNTPPRPDNLDFEEYEEDVRVYQYVKAETWRDSGRMPVKAFSMLVNNVVKIAKEGITMVHCSAGVGRSGTLIVACAINALVKQKILTKDNRNETIAALVRAVRMQRGPLAVQTKDQMELLFDYANSELGV